MTLLEQRRVGQDHSWRHITNPGGHNGRLEYLALLAAPVGENRSRGNAV